MFLCIDTVLMLFYVVVYRNNRQEFLKMDDEIMRELTDLWNALNLTMQHAIKLEKRNEDLELRIRYLEGDPCSPPATADDFDLPEEGV